MKLFRFFLLFFMPFFSHAQPYGNEWINYNQQYLKISVTSNGVYKLEYSVLNSSLAAIGVSLASIDPKNFQLYARGKEQPIDIIGENDGRFDVADYLIFCAETNDGWFDDGLYQLVNKPRLNPHFSLFSDTATYFLTWNNSTNNMRYSADDNLNFTNKNNKSYFFSEIIKPFQSTYILGELDGAGVSAPFFVEGEGWGSLILSSKSSRFIDFQTTNVYNGTNAPAGTLTTTVTGISNATGSPNHRLGIQWNSSSILDTTFTGYELVYSSKQINSSSFQLNNKVLFEKLALSPEPAVDYMTVGYGKVEYSHSSSLSGESYIEMWVPQNTDTSYFNFTNFSAGSVKYIYDLELGIKYKTQQTGTTIKVLIAPGAKRKCILTSENQYNNIGTLSPVSNINSTNGYFIDYKNLAPDSAFIIVSHPSIWSAANQYANYKNQTGNSTLLVSINDLYDQYAFGISKHPLAIKNLVENLLITKPSAPPKYLFLAGKSIKGSYTRKNLSNRSKNKIPTIGSPPADNLYGATLRGNNPKLSIAIGRIAAVTNDDLLNYLEKVKQHDQQTQLQPFSINDAIWKKRAIHFIGGNNKFEQNVFSDYMSGFEQLFTSPKMNGKVHSYKRFNTGSSGTIQFDTVQQLINSGVSLLTFFGHGSNGQLGIDLGDPSDYNFGSKYPLFIANSCNVGDYHLPNENAVSINEKWMLTKNKGAIGFIASTSAGYPTNLNKYTSNLYSNLVNLNYGNSIGTLMLAASAGMNLNNKFDVRTAMEMNLHGDPSIILASIQYADFAIERAFVKAPEVVSADNASFQISVPVYNLGMGTDSIVKIQLQWRFPNGSDSVFVKEFRDNSFVQNVVFDLPIDEKNTIGENTFSLHVNPDLVINEIYPTQNNVINNIRINITSDDLIPIWPKNYAIVPSKNLQLAANTADLFASESDYVFELDINDQYNSPMKKTATIRSKGGVIIWDPNIAHAPDSVVYYWRCSPKKDNPADLKWREHSFQIIPDQEGWSQADFKQYKNNRFRTLVYSQGTATFDFIDGAVSISGSTKGFPSGLEFSTIKWSKDGEIQGRSSFCSGIASMLVSVIDPYTLESWETRYFDNTTAPPSEYNANRNYGNYNDPAQSSCPERDMKFMFRVNEPAEMDSMISMITKHVPDSFYILIMTGKAAYFRDTTIWKERHLRAFENLGSDSIRTIKTDHPHILFTQKGNPSKKIEVVGTDPNSAISVTTSLFVKIGNGNMESVIIGPAKDWDKLSWSYSSNSVNDSMNLNITGIDNTGNEISIADIVGTQKDISNLDNQFPRLNNFNYLKFTGNFFDKTNFTSPQLNKWQVYFTEVPEFAIDPGELFHFHSDTVLQGEQVILAAQIVNASRIDAEKLRIRAYLRGDKNEIIELPMRTIDELKSWQTQNDSLIVTTAKLGGHYTLTMELNPLDTNWQPEGKHFNNLVQKSFFVKSDKLNPLLDVTFDGIHILDGDIVSARPEIRMSLNDKNQFLPLDDTSNFEVYLSDPNKNQIRIYFIENGRENLLFEPSNGKKNSASIQYNPILKTDGIYTLSVNASDANGNRSGNKDYQITFEVINRSTITHVMNYPNPFTTRTQFVFTLTGYKIPDLFRVQILTISGRVIREIDKHELGHLHIGRNITEYAWDGRDEFGDRLANGVYFYRVLTKIEGETVEHRDSGADGYFKKEFGKMYLMR